MGIVSSAGTNIFTCYTEEEKESRIAISFNLHLRCAAVSLTEQIMTALLAIIRFRCVRGKLGQFTQSFPVCAFPSRPFRTQAATVPIHPSCHVTQSPLHSWSKWWDLFWQGQFNPGYSFQACLRASRR